MNKRAEKLLDKLRSTTIGIDTQYPLADGRTCRRVYLDSTASTLQLGVAKSVMDKYLPYYANTHTDAHFNAKLSTREYIWAHNMVLDFVNADAKQYVSFFVGSGTTAAINRIAQTMSRKFPERDVVIATVMEHHSNDLPHRENFSEVVYLPVTMEGGNFSAVDLEALKQALEKHAGRVNYVAVTGVSNVTGIINPIYDIAEMAHQYGTLILVDAAQMAAHVPIYMNHDKNPKRHLDMLAMSGHKLYNPYSPGVVITRKALFEDINPVEVGGGMVEVVHVGRYLPIQSFPEREEAGTPNIAGAIALGSVLYTLKKIGMDNIAKHEVGLVNYCLDKLLKLDHVKVYGQTDTHQCRRTGAISINVRGMHHALVAAILNDYFNVAVRNACFCAQPYVREMITEDLDGLLIDMGEDMTNEELEVLAELHRGMVRASFGIYNTCDDVDILINALKDICENKEHYQAQYIEHAPGEYIHKNFRFDSAEFFSTQRTVDEWLL